MCRMTRLACLIFYIDSLLPDQVQGNFRFVILSLRFCLFFSHMFYCLSGILVAGTYVLQLKTTFCFVINTVLKCAFHY